jgi:Ig-like domain from next to BRCA1 gene
MVQTAAVLLFSLLLAACLPSRSAPTPTEDIQAIYTSAAVTMQAKMTLEAGETAAAILTQQVRQATRMVVPPKQPTETQLPPTATAPAPTAVIVPPPTSTSLPPTTPPPVSCDRAELIGDVSVPPNTLLPAGSVFTKVWRVRNIGTCTWTPSYALNFTGGSLVPVVNTTFLSGNVSPGQTVDLSVNLTAPALPGVYQSGWMLRNANGQFFGVGLNGSDPLVVLIQTYQLAIDTNFIFDLTAYYCAGSWRSGAGALACPGSPDDSSGSVLSYDSPSMEGQSTNEIGLWVRPNQQTNGWITGTMPAYTVQSGDFFLSEIGCLQDSLGCDVIFELDYQIVNGVSGQLGRWREVYDGVTTEIDADLSDLAGRSIYLVLSVYNNGQVSDANAIWLQPRVQQSFQRTDPVLTWSRRGYSSRNSCDELRIFYTSANTAVAQAFDCRQGSQLLGRISLTSDEVSRLSSWVQRLEESEGQIYSATQDRPVTSNITLRGTGSGVATNGDLRAMDNFAAQIFGLIGR